MVSDYEPPTYDFLDDLVDTDPIRLRDVAWEAVREVERLRAEIKRLETEVRSA